MSNGGRSAPRRTIAVVLVVNRFRVPPAAADTFRADLERAHDLLAARPGYLGGAIGRNVDDPDLWVLQTRWADPGSYRRALSSMEVKMHAVPVLSGALDEPSAYEIVDGDEPLNEARPRTL